MNLSEFEHRVLSVLIDGDLEGDTLAQQLASAAVEQRESTGVGFYTKLAVDPSTPTLETSERYIEKTPRAHLLHPALPAGAGAMLWIVEGRIDTLECYTFEGSWPNDESLFSITR